MTFGAFKSGLSVYKKVLSTSIARYQDTELGAGTTGLVMHVRLDSPQAFGG